jgi:hypothetical protein
LGKSIISPGIQKTKTDSFYIFHFTFVIYDWQITANQIQMENGSFKEEAKGQSLIAAICQS